MKKTKADIIEEAKIVMNLLKSNMSKMSKLSKSELEQLLYNLTNAALDMRLDEEIAKKLGSVEW
jgi:hypothetical protein